MESSRGNRAPELTAAAEELFVRKGYGGTTMEQVSRRCGFSKRTVYLYFKNKDELFLSVVGRALAELRVGLEAIAVDELGFEEAIGAITEVYIRFATESPAYFRLVFQEANKEMLANVSEALREQLAAHERACLAVPARVVARGVATGIVPPIDAQEAAVVFWGSVTGIILLSLGGSQTVLPDNRIDIIRRAVWVLYHGYRGLPEQLWPAGHETQPGAHAAQSHEVRGGSQ